MSIPELRPWQGLIVARIPSQVRINEVARTLGVAVSVDKYLDVYDHNGNELAKNSDDGSIELLLQQLSETNSITEWLEVDSVDGVIDRTSLRSACKE